MLSRAAAGLLAKEIPGALKFQSGRRLPPMGLVAWLGTEMTAGPEPAGCVRRSAAQACSYGSEQLEDISFSGQPYRRALIHPLADTFDASQRVGSQIPDVIASSIREPLQAYSEHQNSGLNRIDESVGPHQHPGKSGVGATTALRYGSIPIEISSDKCWEECFGELWRDERPSLPGNYIPTRQRAHQRDAADHYFREWSGLGGVVTVSRDGLISIQRPPKRVEMFFVFPGQSDGKASALNASIGRNKAEPVRFRVGVDLLEVGDIKAVADRPMGAQVLTAFYHGAI